MRKPYQIAISPKGVAFRVRPGQKIPDDWKLFIWSDYYFKTDGSLKERFTRLPIYAHQAYD